MKQYLRSITTTNHRSTDPIYNRYDEIVTQINVCNYVIMMNHTTTKLNIMQLTKTNRNKQLLSDLLYY